ncbi:MAG: SDR family oxidoreductase, partial [Chloroflexota bacterium]|nr:SDR family oxidoreductase [Chloroflexota bacterium]
MRVFVTGASGYIGSAIVRELSAAGHQILGLARSDAAAAQVASAGADVHRGALDDLDSLRSGAAAADGVIHTAYIHDFSDFARAAQTDLRAVETIGAALEESGKPFVVTSGTLMLTFLLPPGRLGTEENVADAGSLVPRIASENAAIALAEHGVRSSIVRLPPSVHGESDHGFVPTLISIARARGMSAYPGDGSNHWPAVHRLDAAHLFRLALEKAPAGSVLHAVADEGVPVREIAGVIGRRLNVP